MQEVNFPKMNILQIVSYNPTENDRISSLGEVFKLGDVWINTEESLRYRRESIDNGKASWKIEVHPGPKQDL